MNPAIAALDNTLEDDTLDGEIARRAALGSRCLSVAAFTAEFARLGYTLDRSMDCRSIARYLASGHTYPAISTYPREADSGLSARNVGARRDDKYRAMRALRQEIFAVSRGAILEV